MRAVRPSTLEQTDQCDATRFRRLLESTLPRFPSRPYQDRVWQAARALAGQLRPLYTGRLGALEP